MKTISLDELIKKITPLMPLASKSYRYPLGDTGDYDDVSAIESKDGAEIAADHNSDSDSTEALAYLVHAANTLPELVDSLKNAVNELECSGLCFDHPLLNKYNAIIVKASTVNL